MGGTPPVITHGQGPRVFDTDGNSYLDYVGSWGPLILGHTHPDVLAAIQEAVTRGSTFGAPTEAEIDLAELIVAAVQSVEQVRLVSSGTEACMTAVRLARAATERTHIIKFVGGYHGHADPFLVQAGSGNATFGRPDSAGVPKEIAAMTLVAPYNDAEAVEELFARHPEEIAAVIVEPVAANMGVIPPADGFLDSLRQMTNRYGALLIFDEVITGFRVAWGGAQELYDITPDLTCFGKIVGGGMPLAAVGGRRQIMELLAPVGPVYQAGTLSGNPVAVAAGIATLKVIRANSVYPRIDSLGQLLQDGLITAAMEAAVPVTVNRVGSLLTVFFGDFLVCDFKTASQTDSESFRRFFNAMLDEGFYLPPSPFEAWFLSDSHNEADVRRTIEAASRSLKPRYN